MTSILDAPDTAEAVADKPAEPAVSGSCPGSEQAVPPAVQTPGDPQRPEAGNAPATQVPGEPQAHPVVRFTESLAGALDRLAPVAAWSMTPKEQRRVLVELNRQLARLRELQLRVLVAGDRNGIGADSGATSTPAWLAHETKATRAGCFRDLHLAQALDEEFEATRGALAAGRIDEDKAWIIIRAVRALTEEYDELPEGTHAKAEAHLLDLAQRFDAPTLRGLGKRLFEVVCPEAADQAEGAKLGEEEERARRTAYLTMHDNGDGSTEGRFRLPSLHAAVLKKALQALTAPRRIGQGRVDPKTGKKLPASTLAGQGFMELLENHLNLDTLPSRNGSPFRVVVTIPLEYLCTGLGVAVSDVGVRISAGEVRRLSCQAGILPMVLDVESVPLDLGREKRLFDKNQAIVLDQLFGGCAAANCDRPPGWVEYHHQESWCTGGKTDLNNGLPLCPPHHHMADHPESWAMHRQPDGRVRFHRRT